MTVKCLKTLHKDTIVSLYTAKHMNQKELAQEFCVSERTINRVLIEAGVATAVPRLKGEAYRAMQILKKHEISVDELDALLKSFYQKLQEPSKPAAVAALFRPIQLNKHSAYAGPNTNCP